jgi:hypothetical protein
VSGLTREDVKAVLDEIGSFKYVATLAGFDLPAPVLARNPGDARGYKSGDDYRLVKGGGIAGDNRWWLTRITGDRQDSQPAGTKRDLRRLLIEWLTTQESGQRPVDRHGYIIYAQRHSNRFGEHYIWCYRKRRRAAYAEVVA